MNINIADFQKLDIRIGTVVAAEIPDWSHWVMKLSVDLGPEVGKKVVFAGLIKFYKKEDLVDKQFPFIVNIEPKKIGPKAGDGSQNYSEAMLLAATIPIQEDGNNERPVLFYLSEKVPNGTKVR